MGPHHRPGGGARREAPRARPQRRKKESPAGGVGHVGTKVGVWEEGSIAQNSKAVGSRSDSWWIFLRRRLGALKPDRAPVTDAPARERLLPPIRFGEDFQARPAFEARHVRIALNLHAAKLHWIFAGRAERRISTQRIVVSHDRADFQNKNRPRQYEVDRAFCNCGNYGCFMLRRSRRQRQPFGAGG
jgi:hypothetical protein